MAINCVHRGTGVKYKYFTENSWIKVFNERKLQKKCLIRLK